MMTIIWSTLTVLAGLLSFNQCFNVLQLQPLCPGPPNKGYQSFLIWYNAIQKKTQPQCNFFLAQPGQRWLPQGWITNPENKFVIFCPSFHIFYIFFYSQYLIYDSTSATLWLLQPSLVFFFSWPTFSWTLFASFN